jgi:tetratricopeptide (TPR) repeat protein
VGDPVELNFDLAKIQQEDQKSQQSNPEYQKALAEQKQTANLKEMFEQGRALYAQKQYTEAAAIFEKALPLAKDKNVTIVIGQLADTYAKAASVESNPDTRKQDQAKAMDYYQKDLQADPNDASLHNNLGSLYADMGKTEEAAAEFKKAADLDPVHASGYYYNLGAIMVNKGQMDAAAEALKKATEIDPNYALAWYWYGTALMGKAQVKPDGTMVPAPGTIEAFQTYLKLQPNGPNAATAQASIDALSSKQNLEFKSGGKGKAKAAPPSSPLTAAEVLNLVKSGMESADIEDQARKRGIAFQVTSNTEHELRTAGATENLIKLLESLSSKP